MPKLSKKWAEIDETAGGGFSDIEPGAYALVITNVEPVPAREFARLFWDVAEGERKGAYAQSQYPPSDVLSWKESALGMLKHKLHVLADANPGFMPTKAFEADDWRQFVGKRFYAVVRRRIYTAGPNSKQPGADRYAVEVARWLKPEEFKAGTWPESLLADRDQRTTAQQPEQQVAQVPPTFSPDATPDLYGEDVPF